MALAEPMPKSQLFWMGTLMRLATGFDSFLASSAAAALSSVAASCANAVVVENASALTSARRMRFCLCVVFIVSLRLIRLFWFAGAEAHRAYGHSILSIGAFRMASER